jgi:hypothetical protein
MRAALQEATSCILAFVTMTRKRMLKRDTAEKQDAGGIRL